MVRYRAYLWAAPLLLIGILLVAMAFVSGPIQAKSGGFYRQTNLVSDIPGLARFTDSNLVNPWGLSQSCWDNLSPDRQCLQRHERLCRNRAKWIRSKPFHFCHRRRHYIRLES